MKVYCIDAILVVTDSKLVVQLQKSDEDQVRCQREEPQIQQEVKVIW